MLLSSCDGARASGTNLERWSRGLCLGGNEIEGKGPRVGGPGAPAEDRACALHDAGLERASIEIDDLGDPGDLLGARMEIRPGVAELATRSSSPAADDAVYDGTRVVITQRRRVGVLMSAQTK